MVSFSPSLATWSIMGADGCIVGELDSTRPTTYTGCVIGLAQSSARSVKVRLDCASVTSTPFNPTFTTRTPGGRFSTEHGTRPLKPLCRATCSVTVTDCPG